METSVFIARLIGPILIVAGLSALINPKLLKEVAEEFMAGHAMLFLAGFSALLAGLAIVNTHNVWTLGWPVIITLLGWMTIIAGIIRMGFPEMTKSIGKNMLAREKLLPAIAGSQILLGLFLSYVGYF